ncbi:cyclodeaminase [Salibacterium halotolerans]|uniref:Ornithine cyclodeaminase n=1 Tax=Salibacterium halotolerans TaxID=1884432 RepID=A0A1I5V5E8_9BACI|nr:cyclodeaminase [Salibacterium halotolerans]SFQ02708.1 ornithine cyclodeaminase [Salibacterium halotolerans]
MYIFSEKELRQVVHVNKTALELVEEGFQKLEQGEVTMPPVLRVDIPENNGEVDVKTAYVKGKDLFALKMSSGFFNNADKGLPSLSGMMLLLSTQTGFTEALLQDNGYLTDVRTAAAGGVAADHLAPASVITAGVIGTGTQARYQIRALQLVRKLDQVLVYGRKPERVQQYISEMEHELGVPVKAAGSPEEVVRNSDVVITTTPAKQPIIQKEWLHPGLHITAMGSDAEEKNEVAPGVLQAVDVLACDSKAQVFKLGEHHHALEAGTIKESSDIRELGALSLGRASGRTSDAEVTFCDLTGTGVQDTAIAVHAYQSLLDAGKGTTFEG